MRHRPRAPDRILIKGGLRPGDRLFLSKPLGTGVITTAGKNGVAGDEVLAGAVAACSGSTAWPPRSRVRAGEGATDITGFGFLGHAGEMVEASGAGIAIERRGYRSCRARWL